MIRPVAHRRQRAGQRRQLAGHEVAEALAAGVHVFVIAIREVHRHVEQVIDIAFVTEAVVEHEVEHAGAVAVGIGPDVRTVGQITVGLAFGERRIGEQRGGDGLQRQRDAEFLHHVRFAAVIQIHLHGAGAGHHVQTEAADLGHVVAHDLVAALGHPRHFVATPFRLEAHAEEAEPEFVGDRLHFLQMAAHLGAGLVDVLQRCAREFELAGGFQRDRGVVLEQGDGAVVLLHRLPAETGEAIEQGFDAALASEGGCVQIVEAEAELFVLGADAPVGCGFLAGGEFRHQLVAMGEGRIGDMAGAGHGGSTTGG